ncbi:DUF6504 family protein [Sphingomonas sp. TX0543]|uniref:DUF6504 family protein n=1 Tax=Sphingomonas sp. TX0543 TaxID=3399682 RepID=UPI003AFB4933
MNRVASLYLPHLAIERIRLSERVGRLEPSIELPDRGVPFAEPPFRGVVDDNPGACSVPRGGGWRPGARWAQGHARSSGRTLEEPSALPGHRRPAKHETGRRSEGAHHPFRAIPPDERKRGPAVNSSRALRQWTRPLILIERVGQKEVVTAACLQALELGLVPGMAAAHARALAADLDVRDAEPERDRDVLDRLALHAVGRWTPTASVSGPDGLWLDLTGTTHLFGGEERFCRRLLRFLRRFGYTATIAIAGSPGAAHALARFSDAATTIVPAGSETAAIAQLPLAALRLTPDALSAASRFGLERIVDLYPMPRGPLAKRLGLSAVTRLDQARGLVAEPLVPVVPFEMPRVERRLLEPIGTAEAIVQIIGDLVDDMAAVLETRGFGLRAAVLTCLCVDGLEQRIGLGTARATRDAKHLKRMFALRVERIAPGLGIEAMTLAAPRVEALQPAAMPCGLIDGERTPDLAPLVDQLAGRVGDDALFRMAPRESDVPERAVRRMGALEIPTGWSRWTRPARLLARPEMLSHVVALLPDHPPRRFVWRGKAYEVVAGDGPERIHGEWWRTAREMWAVRDYFQVEAEGGERFWLFRRGDGVDVPTGDLSWYLHGLFG